jgi:hypothetical protein
LRKAGEASRFASSEGLENRDASPISPKTQNSKPKTILRVRRSFIFLSILSWGFTFQLQAQPRPVDLTEITQEALFVLFCSLVGLTLLKVGRSELEHAIEQAREFVSPGIDAFTVPP